ncbi:hypothetical protein [Methanococcoides sp. LMO-2]|uniref:Uncharacterized protein n=1 Tax=Methanococcoides cohabitans TaxID=3136559 RepID=A0ABU9KQ18_9EURY
MKLDENGEGMKKNRNHCLLKIRLIRQIYKKIKGKAFNQNFPNYYKTKQDQNGKYGQLRNT